MHITLQSPLPNPLRSFRSIATLTNSQASSAWSRKTRRAASLGRDQVRFEFHSRNRLVFTHANPERECFSLAVLWKFVSQTLQSSALREKTTVEPLRRVQQFANAFVKPPILSK